MTSRTCISERLRLPVISAVAVSVLALAGCSDGGDPQTGPTATAVASPAASGSGSASAKPSATPSPKPTPAYKPADAKGRAQNVPVPVKPALADKNTKEGLEAFTKYWYQALSYAYETGDTSLVQSISGPNCRFCSGLAEGLESAWEGAQWVAGGKIETPSVTGKYTRGAKTQQATVQVIQKEIAIYKAPGKLLQAVTKESNTASQAVVSFDSKGWSIIDLGLIR